MADAPEIRLSRFMDKHPGINYGSDDQEDGVDFPARSTNNASLTTSPRLYATPTIGSPSQEARGRIAKALSSFKDAFRRLQHDLYRERSLSEHDAGWSQLQPIRASWDEIGEKFRQGSTEHYNLSARWDSQQQLWTLLDGAGRKPPNPQAVSLFKEATRAAVGLLGTSPTPGPPWCVWLDLMRRERRGFEGIPPVDRQSEGPPSTTGS
jgi:hypothetical protein